MLAIIKTGGKQYKVQPGDVLKIEKIDKKQGSKIVFDDVLLVSDKSGKKTKIGIPKVRGAKVEAKILFQGRAKKVEVVKYKPKTRYRKKRGHRQAYSKIEITGISGPL